MAERSSALQVPGRGAIPAMRPHSVASWAAGFKVAIVRLLANAARGKHVRPPTPGGAQWVREPRDLKKEIDTLDTTPSKRIFLSIIPDYDLNTH